MGAAVDVTADVPVRDVGNDAPPISFEADIWPILSVTCVGARCHGRTFSAGDRMASYEWLLRPTGISQPDDCSEFRVTPGAVTESSAIQKLRGTVGRFLSVR